MSQNSNQPRRQRRLHRVFDVTPAYFLTMCTENRVQVLDDPVVFDLAKTFIEGSPERYGVYVDSLVFMPDHTHLIICIASASNTTLGQWVKAFKAMTARQRFKWQAGFFDHVLRSDESRSEKWEYIRMNPVRAQLVTHPEEWPYAIRLNPCDGTAL